MNRNSNNKSIFQNPSFRGVWGGHYFKIAWRNLAKHKLFTIINVLCLTIGLTFTLLIGVYIVNQRQINSNLKDVHQQYILKSNWKVQDMGLAETTLGPLPKTLQQEYPQLVKNYYRYNPVTNVITAGDKSFKEEISIGDTTFVNMYGLPLVAGNPAQPFINNSSAIITASFAKKLFGTTNVIGKTVMAQTLVAGEKQPYAISAVLADMPYNSVFNYINETYSIYIPFEGSKYFGDDDYIKNWNSANIVGAIQLQDKVSASALNIPLKNILKKYADKEVQESLTVLPTAVEDYYINNPDVKRMLLALSIIALFILVMAVINYININIGISASRVKEIGLRKVFGSLKKQLIFQFIIESVIITFMAASVSLVLYEILNPYFSALLNTSLTHFWQFGAGKTSMLILLVLIVAFAAGAYPAFVLSSYNVVHSIKGKLNSSKGGLVLRKSLITLQFTLAIIVLIAALNVSKQVAYVFNKDLGYRKEGVMVITAFPKQWDSAGVKKMQFIMQGLQQLPIVKDASLSFEIPDRKPPNTVDILPSGTTVSSPLFIPSFPADKNYAATFGLQMLSGTFFNQTGANIPWQIVLNESAAKAMGYTAANAVGKPVLWKSANYPLTISGVVKDFNYSNMQEKIEPVAFLNVDDMINYRYISLKLQAQNIDNAIAVIKKKWNELSPGNPFEYSFMEDKFKALYSSELQLKSATQLASILNIVIVFMGVFGVVAFTLARRQKEIAVRKVLGADVKKIILLFIKEYAWLILIANIIAWPVTYIINNYWLMNYAYRIQQSLLSYVFASVLILLIVVIFISLQTVRAALANPVKSLRSE